MQSKGFWAAAKKVRPSHVDLSCESEPDFGGHNNNRKQRADRTAPETRGSIFCGVFPGQRTRRNLFNLINFPQFKLMRERETLVENFHRPVQISCRASTVRWPLCDFGPDGFANVLRLGKRTCDLIYPWRLAKKKLSFRSLRNLSNPECTSVTQHRHTEIDANVNL